MADDLTFGPEWLRALTDGSSIISPPVSPGFVPKYKLSEYRYGREEMLALFVPDSFVPEHLKFLQSICVDNIQHPLAFVPLSDEEQILIAQGVNSSAVLRLMGKGGTVARGRGINDRGRGRGRGRGEGFFTKESEDSGLSRCLVVQSESWEESSDNVSEKPEHIHSEPDDAIMHKELVKSVSSDSWHEGQNEQIENEGDGWLCSGSKERSRKEDWVDVGQKYIETDSYDYVNNRRKLKTAETYEEDEELPEWIVAENHGDIGTFDSSGAFMSMKGKIRNEENTSLPVKLQKETNKNCENNPTEIQHGSNSIINSKKNSQTSAASDSKISSGLLHNGSMITQEYNHQSSVEFVDNPIICHNNNISDDKEDKRLLKQGGLLNCNINKDMTNEINENDLLLKDGGSPVAMSSKNSLSVTEKEHKNKEANKKDFDQKVELTSLVKPNPGDIGDNSVQDRAVLQKGNEFTSSEKDISMTKDLKKTEFVLNNQIADEGDVSTDNNGFGFSGYSDNVVSSEDENEQKWFYRDPQGEMQGPFNPPEMAEWFSAGYFTMNLMVKRGNDEEFLTLGEMIKRWGRVPFLPGTSLSPAEDTSIESTKYQQVLDSENSAAIQNSCSVGESNKSSDVQIKSHSDQMKAFMLHQHQAVLMQQQAVVQQAVAARHIQMQQAIHFLQHSEAWNRVPQEQQHDVTLEMMMKQQDQQCITAIENSKPEKPIVAEKSDLASEITKFEKPVVNKNSAVASEISSQKTFQQQQEKPISQSTVGPPTESDDKSQQLKSDLKTLPEENNITASIWGTSNKAGNWNQTTTVWDVEQTGKAKSMEEIEKEELEKAQKEKQKIEEKNKEKKSEKEKVIKPKQLKKSQGHKTFQSEVQKQSKKHVANTRKQNPAEIEKNQMEEQPNNQQYKTIIDEKKQGAQEKCQISKDRQRHRKDNKMEVDFKIPNEREQEAQIQIQEKEAFSYIQKEKILNIKLPQQAHWGSAVSPVKMPDNKSDLSLQQIQEQEVLKEKKEQDEINNKKVKKQQEAIQWQEEKAIVSWVNNKQQTQQQETKSLLEIQQEQAKQHLKDIQDKQTKSQHQGVAAPLSSSAWSGQEYSWGSIQNKKPQGFWDDTASGIASSKHKAAKINNTHFPALTTTVCESTQSKTKQAKVKKEEECVQQLFQTMIPKDDFTEWCENALQKFDTSVHVPTFINFMLEVDSPYEVHDYARQFLGESRETTDFAKQFIEKRLQYKTSRAKKEDFELGTSAASSSNISNNHAVENNNEDTSQRKGKKLKKVKQRVDNSILGFTCTAATERVNVGEIDSL